MKTVERQDWVTQHGFPWEENWLKPRLLEEFEDTRDNTTMVEMFAENHGQRVLW